LWPFGVFFPVLACCSKKNLATLGRMQGDQIGLIFDYLAIVNFGQALKITGTAQYFWDPFFPTEIFTK
jgi:hypothetical protein